MTGAAKGAVCGRYGALDSGLLATLEHRQDTEHIGQRGRHDLAVIVGRERLPDPEELRALRDFRVESGEVKTISGVREDAAKLLLKLR